MQRRDQSRDVHGGAPRRAALVAGDGPRGASGGAGAPAARGARLHRHGPHLRQLRLRRAARVPGVPAAGRGRRVAAGRPAGRPPRGLRHRDAALRRGAAVRPGAHRDADGPQVHDGQPRRVRRRPLRRRRAAGGARRRGAGLPLLPVQPPHALADAPPPAPRRGTRRHRWRVPRHAGARQAPRLRAGARRRHPAAAPGPDQRRVPVDGAPRREVPRRGRHTGEHVRRRRARRRGRAPAARAVAPAGVPGRAHHTSAGDDGRGRRRR